MTIRLQLVWRTKTVAVPFSILLLSNHLLDVASDFVSALALRLHFEVCGMNAHAGNETDCFEYANQLPATQTAITPKQGAAVSKPPEKWALWKRPSLISFLRCYEISNESYLTRRPFLDGWMKSPRKFPKMPRSRTHRHRGPERQPHLHGRSPPADSAAVEARLPERRQLSRRHQDQRRSCLSTDRASRCRWAPHSRPRRHSR